MISVVDGDGGGAGGNHEPESSFECEDVTATAVSMVENFPHTSDDRSSDDGESLSYEAERSAAVEPMLMTAAASTSANVSRRTQRRRRARLVGSQASSANARPSPYVYHDDGKGRIHKARLVAQLSYNLRPTLKDNRATRFKRPGDPATLRFSGGGSTEERRGASAAVGKSSRVEKLREQLAGVEVVVDEDRIKTMTKKVAHEQLQVLVYVYGLKDVQLSCMGISETREALLRAIRRHRNRFPVEPRRSSRTRRETEKMKEYVGGGGT